VLYAIADWVSVGTGGLRATREPHLLPAQATAGIQRCGVKSEPADGVPVRAAVVVLDAVRPSTPIGSISCVVLPLFRVFCGSYGVAAVRLPMRGCDGYLPCRSHPIVPAWDDLPDRRPVIGLRDRERIRARWVGGPRRTEVADHVGILRPHTQGILAEMPSVLQPTQPAGQTRNPFSRNRLTEG